MQMLSEVIKQMHRAMLTWLSFDSRPKSAKTEEIELGEVNTLSHRRALIYVQSIELRRNKTENEEKLKELRDLQKSLRAKIKANKKNFTRKFYLVTTSRKITEEIKKLKEEVKEDEKFQWLNETASDYVTKMIPVTDLRKRTMESSV